MIQVLDETQIENVNQQPICNFDYLTELVGWVIENGQVTAMEY